MMKRLGTDSAFLQLCGKHTLARGASVASRYLCMNVLHGRQLQTTSVLRVLGLLIASYDSSTKPSLT